MLSSENRVHSKHLTLQHRFVLQIKMFEQSQSLWRSKKQKPPCLPVRNGVLQSWHSVERCYQGLPQKPEDADPAALTLHKLTASSAGDETLRMLVVSSSSQAGLRWACIWSFPTVKSPASTTSTVHPSCPPPCTGTTTHAHSPFSSSFLPG